MDGTIIFSLNRLTSKSASTKSKSWLTNKTKPRVEVRRDFFFFACLFVCLFVCFLPPLLFLLYLRMCLVCFLFTSRLSLLLSPFPASLQLLFIKMYEFTNNWTSLFRSSLNYLKHALKWTSCIILCLVFGGVLIQDSVQVSFLDVVALKRAVDYLI